MKLKAWAVVCANGSVHETDEFSLLTANHQHGIDQLAQYGDMDEVCGPHRLIALQSREFKATK